MTILTQDQFDALPVGSIVEYRGGNYVSQYQLTPDGWRQNGYEYDPDDFRHSITLERLHLVSRGVESPSTVTRSYDFNKGDRRFVTAERAIEYAEIQTAGTGRLHVARKDPGSYPFLTLWLVQEVEDR